MVDNGGLLNAVVVAVVFYCDHADQIPQTNIHCVFVVAVFCCSAFFFSSFKQTHAHTNVHLNLAQAQTNIHTHSTQTMREKQGGEGEAGD